MTTTATDITTATKITVLKHLVSRGIYFAANVTGLTDAQVLDLASHHGYPDTDKMRWAIDLLTKDADRTALDALPTSAAPAAKPAARPSGYALRPVAPPVQAQAMRRPDTAGEAFTDLLRTANDCGDKKLTRLATRADAAVTALEAGVKAWRAGKAERDAADRELAAKAARIAALKAELAALTGKPGERKPGSGGATGGPQTCAQCQRTFGSSQAVALHRRRAHEGFNPKAAKSA